MLPHDGAADLCPVGAAPAQLGPDIPTLARSLHCFRGAEQQPRPAPRSRAKLSDSEKQRVHQVRRRRACLRCRMLKIQCSNEDPCQTCLQSAVKGSERRVLSFCYCVRTRFADINIFFSETSHAPTMQIETLLSRMSALLVRIATPAEFTLTSDPATFNTTLTSWLTDPTFSFPNGSVVGLCCSSLLSLQFQDPDPLSGDDGLMTEFRRFLLSTSLAHSGWTGEIPQSELLTAGHVSGYRLIKRLDRILTPQFLSKLSQESTQMLFLLVLGAVLGVGYSSAMPPSPSPSLPTSPSRGSSRSEQQQQPQPPSMSMMSHEFTQSPTLYLSMKEHLCQMLAHHLIFLGSSLGIKLDTTMEQRIIDTAAVRWNKMEKYAWAEAQGGLPFSTPQVDARSYEFQEKERMWNPPYWGLEEPPPAPPPFPGPGPGAWGVPGPTLYAIACPETDEFSPEPLGEWEGNPQSYLEMAMEDEPESYEYSAGSGDNRNNWSRDGQRSNTEPVLRRAQGFGDDVRREVKSRTIWLVRPIDGGPERGQVNLHTRLRGERGGIDFRLFV
ncbi:hypothetical protein B0T16DRAFT_386447 [Cercophora newfieldiana]|uniref:Zn(2)-C6 fungal-type domain-containing protein n=1 Tax=Cercophora newfieldiana TaxID=92897 RepID=A0AA40D089_9PEZI|nr:hypothetical protein B0T16DRAFT_386447 [Cercophora newfieldiana]